jgi:hypothetical protein
LRKIDRKIQFFRNLIPPPLKRALGSLEEIIKEDFVAGEEEDSGGGELASPRRGATERGGGEGLVRFGDWQNQKKEQRKR